MSWMVDHLGRSETLDEDSGGPFEIVDAPVEVVIRFCGEDSQAHLYLRTRIIDPQWQRLAPVCEAAKPHPRDHARRQIGATDLVGPDRHDMCPACTVWTRHHPHTITVAGRAA